MRTVVVVLVVGALVFGGIWWLMSGAEQRCAAQGGSTRWLGSGLAHICIDKDGRII